MSLLASANLMPTTEIREREFSPLEAIADNFPKYVLTMDEVDFSRNGIIHCPIEDFLRSGLIESGAIHKVRGDVRHA